MGLPPALQAMFDRSGDESFMDDIRRQADERAEAREREQYAKHTTPRPQNVHYEPQARTSVQRSVNDGDFGEMPEFVTPRRRANFEYVNVSSPDKKAEPEATAEPMHTTLKKICQMHYRGTFSMDDDYPTEAMDS